MKAIYNKSGLGFLSTAPWNTLPIQRKLAENLVSEFGTGNKFRLMQTWATKYEIRVDNQYYVINMKDQGQSTITYGSDL
jgi:hypothetical protein